MSDYLCFIYVKPDAVPELRILDCDGDQQVKARLAATLGEWPKAHRIEVIHGDRVILVATGSDVGLYR